MLVHRGKGAGKVSGLVDINCLCGRTNLTVTLAAEIFPVDVSLHHSDAARHGTGMLFASYLPLARPPVYEGCTEYILSKETSCLFCETCSCHLICHHKLNEECMVASGVIRHVGDVIKVAQHEIINETVDGGVVSFTQTAQGHIKRLSGEIGGKQMLINNTDSIAAQQQPLGVVDKTLAQCHCHAVRFFMTPPNSLSEKISLPWPDVLVPYHSGSSENFEDAKWWPRANKTKYLAGLCACRSCRLSAGFPIQAWAFIPMTNLLDDDGRPFHMDSRDLRRFISSLGVYRESCKTCGATVFWHSDERPDLIDVSVGLLRAPSGARADTLLEWDRSRVSFH